MHTCWNKIQIVCQWIIWTICAFLLFSNESSPSDDERFLFLVAARQNCSCCLKAIQSHKWIIIIPYYLFDIDNTVKSGMMLQQGSPVRSWFSGSCLCASMWISYAELLLSVNGCVNVRVHGALQWTGVSFKVYFCLTDRLLIHHNPKQQKVLTEIEWVSENIFGPVEPLLTHLLNFFPVVIRFQHSESRTFCAGWRNSQWGAKWTTANLQRTVPLNSNTPFEWLILIIQIGI